MSMIQGWFVAQSIICFLFSNMNVDNVVEIGVHHGKSFTAMMKCAPNLTKALAIDVFSDQKKNYDKSGLGNLDIFKQHLKDMNLLSKVLIHEGSSLELPPS